MDGKCSGNVFRNCIKTQKNVRFDMLFDMFDMLDSVKLKESPRRGVKRKRLTSPLDLSCIRANSVNIFCLAYTPLYYLYLLINKMMTWRFDLEHKIELFGRILNFFFQVIIISISFSAI